MTDANFTPTGETKNYGVDQRALDRVFELMADGQRRWTVEKLRASADGVASVEELAGHLVARSEATDRERVENTLHHRILPKLDDANIVDYDPRSATTRYRGTEPIEAVLDFAATQE